MPAVDFMPRDKGPRGGCNLLVGWCGFLEGTMKLPRRQFLHLAAGATAPPAVSRFAWAQAYPSRPIRLVVPLPPGGAVDALARPWADKIRPLLGTVFVDNVGGAGGSLGAAQVAHARPDGYTLLLGGLVNAHQ